MGMDIRAIRPRGAAVQEEAEDGIARRNRGATNGHLLFRDTAPVLEAIAKGLRTEPVQATEGGLATALKTMAGEIEKTVAAMKAPASKPAAAAPAPVRSTGAPPSVPFLTETQRRRDVEAREEARKSAAQAATDRVLVSKGGAKVLTLRALDATLSENALIALSSIIGRWQEAGRRPVRVRASDTSDATGLTTAQAQADRLIQDRGVPTSPSDPPTVTGDPSLIRTATAPAFPILDHPRSRSGPLAQSGRFPSRSLRPTYASRFDIASIPPDTGTAVPV